LIEEIGKYRVRYTLSDTNRMGDHICYISDLRKMKSHFPEWSIRISLKDMLAKMIETEERKAKSTT
jgi:CDP-paratose 2-epimerase